MFIPRRVRRRLLLPPGWVALGFLLLLGCQALRPWAGQLKQWNVMQITMPAIKTDTSYVRFFKKPTKYKVREEYNPYVTPWSKSAAIALGQMRPWHDVKFSGALLADFLNAAATESALKQIIADSRHAGGVRVRFLPGATYANLIRVLDIMNYSNQKRYWLDIRHQPVTLYAITNKPLVTEPVDCYLCGDVLISHPTPVAHSFRQLLADFWPRVASLGEYVWRQPLLLLLVISGLNLGRLLHKK